MFNATEEELHSFNYLHSNSNWSMSHVGVASLKTNFMVKTAVHKYTTEYDSRLPPVKMEVHSTVLHPSRNMHITLTSGLNFIRASALRKAFRYCFGVF